MKGPCPEPHIHPHTYPSCLSPILKFITSNLITSKTYTKIKSDFLPIRAQKYNWYFSGTTVNTMAITLINIAGTTIPQFIKKFNTSLKNKLVTFSSFMSPKMNHTIKNHFMILRAESHLGEKKKIALWNYFKKSKVTLWKALLNRSTMLSLLGLTKSKASYH